jgi:transposase
MPAAYVRPYVKRGKTVRPMPKRSCETMMRPTMRFVPVKSQEQQKRFCQLHRARDLLVRQRTQALNVLRSPSLRGVRASRPRPKGKMGFVDLARR